MKEGRVVESMSSGQSCQLDLLGQVSEAGERRNAGTIARHASAPDRSGCWQARQRELEKYTYTTRSRYLGELAAGKLAVVRRAAETARAEEWCRAKQAGETAVGDREMGGD